MRKFGARTRLLGAAAAGAILLAAPGAAADDARHQYSVRGDDLGETLRRIAQESGREIIFSGTAVSGKAAPALRGNYTVEEAVALVLAGSGLSADFQKDVILIRGRSEPPGGTEERPADRAEILVTGSRIRGAPTSSPTIVTSRQQIQDRGINDLGEFARSLPQNFSGGQNPSVAGGGAQGENNNVSSSSTLNLRGLGPDATLTLVNGHRVAYDALAQGVDISAIPLAAVERVEVVADGASALYGSDAVGGVANIILRRDFQGLDTSARFGAATSGGAQQTQLSAVGGQLWHDGAIMLAADLLSTTAITARQRNITSSMDDSATLLPRARQYSFVLTGHQALMDHVLLDLDGQFSDRNSHYDNPFSATKTVLISGLRSNPQVRSFSVTPSLKWTPSADWSVDLSGTHGDSRADLHSRRYSNGVETPGRLIYDNSLDSVELGAEGRLFEMAGGSVRLAAGGGYRSLGLDVNVSNTPPGKATVTTENFSTGRNVYFAYGEVSAPLVGDRNAMPLVEQLRLTAAARYENYRGVGSVATPKLGLVYQPYRDVTLKASWGKSFKAPTLYQENQIRQGVLLPGSIFTNNPSGHAVLLFAGGGTPLKPERAKTWSASLELRPRFVPGLSLELSYFDVRYKDRVAVPITGTTSALANPNYARLITLSPTAAQVSQAIAGLPQGLSNQTGAPFDPAAVAAIIDASDRNVSRQRAHGLDLAGRYRADLGGHQQISLSAAASYLLSNRQLTAGQPTVALAGTIFDPPHWRGQAGGTYERGNVTASLFANYIGGTLDDRTSSFVRVGSFTSLDGSVRIRSAGGQGIWSGIELTLSGVNLLNIMPDRIANSDPSLPPYDSTNYPVTGRVVSLTVRKAW